jgi:hypothetical protein
MRAVPPGSGSGDAWLFAFVTQTLVCGIGASLPLGVLGGIVLARGDPDGLEMLIVAACIMVGGGLLTLLTAWIWALITHGLLRMTGGCEHGFRRTLVAILYSSGTNAPMGVPCIGLYCGGWMLWLWWLISAVMMVVEGQRVRGMRATMCVAAFPLALVGATLAGYFALIYVALSQARTTTVQAQIRAMGYQPLAEATTIGSALTQYAAAHNGEFPLHGLQLAVDGSLTAADFVAWQVGHDESNVPVGPTNLTGFQLLGPNRARQAALDAGAVLPANVIAHRLGDVVFTYHGLNAHTADGRLWIAIIDADPGQAATSTGSLIPIAIAVDGSLTPLPPPTQNAALAAQNVLRARWGLPALPKPAEVTHAVPATASTGRAG